MRREKKYLKLYYEWMKTGMIRDSSSARRKKGMGGLCNSVIGRSALELFRPTEHDYNIIPVSIRDSYWAAEKTINCLYLFGPTRQNIVLLLAAMNNEL